jgi:N-acetylgalactosamine kinase
MSSSEKVPVIRLQTCGDSVLMDQLTNLANTFQDRFSSTPSFIVRVPGRVNLIGEHIDYCGFPVFPMAVEKYITFVVGQNQNNLLRLKNVQHSLYPDFTCSLENSLNVNIPPSWSDYFLCGVKGLLTEVCNNNEVTSGMDVLVDGSIPPSAGLSSSSAMVCGAAVVSFFLWKKGRDIDKTCLARDCAVFERWVGTQGGGMDQAIQFLADESTAKFVEFVPSLKATTVSLPDGINFFVSHSGAQCNKGATQYFNTRVLETRMATLLLAKELDISDLEGLTLSGIVTQTDLTLENLSQFAKDRLKAEPYTQESLLRELSASSVSELLERSGVDSTRFAQVIESGCSLKLRDRVVHVFEEADRVYRFKNTCEDQSLSKQHKIRELARLMNESHSSCRDLYECSCPDLDSLVEASLSCGSLGSRLTGAGWGGCCISLVDDESVDSYRSKMKSRYPSDDFTFNTKPSAGITIFSLL